MSETDAERKRCTDIINRWIIAYGDYEPSHTPAKEWAVGALEDILELIDTGKTIEELEADFKQGR